MTTSFTYGSLFSGIGGMDLGFDRAGFRCLWQVERDPFCRAILERHWPGLPRPQDAKIVDESLEKPFAIIGGFPCQPFSVLGKRKGVNDDRYGWPWFRDWVAFHRPECVVLENVSGVLSVCGEAIKQDLRDLGYDPGEWTRLTAAQFGAVHLRRRVFLAAMVPDSTRPRLLRENLGRMGEEAKIALREGPPHVHTNVAGLPDDSGRMGTERAWPPYTGVRRVAHGYPGKMDKSRLKVLGNAVVPAVAQAVAECIIKACRTET